MSLSETPLTSIFLLCEKKQFNYNYFQLAWIVIWFANMYSRKRYYVLVKTYLIELAQIYCLKLLSNLLLCIIRLQGICRKDCLSASEWGVAGFSSGGLCTLKPGKQKIQVGAIHYTHSPWSCDLSDPSDEYKDSWGHRLRRDMVTTHKRMDKELYERK